jgi:putative phosphoesterase
MKLGIISDTHNYFDPKIPDLFSGVDHILHAGDVGKNSILFQLEQIAPVTAVLGNTDSFLDLPETEIVTLAGKKFFLHHIINPRDLAEPIKGRISRERPDAVVFGHSHKPFCETIEGTLYFNPGYAGKSRFGMERTLALMVIDANGIQTQSVKL